MVKVCEERRTEFKRKHFSVNVERNKQIIMLQQLRLSKIFVFFSLWFDSSVDSNSIPVLQLLKRKIGEWGMVNGDK